MRLPPPDVIASWPPANYTDPVRRGPAMLIISLIVAPIAVLLTILRFYVRAFRVKRVWWDDWLMVGAMIFSIGVTVSSILAVQLYGWSIHIWDVSPSKIVQGRQSSAAVQTCFLFASGLAKTSILVSYLRIAPCDSYFRRLTQVTICFVISLMFIFIIVLWTQCIPASAYWEEIQGPQCINEDPPLMAQTISCVFTDFVVYVLPLPTLLQLRLPVCQRLGLLLVFSLGFVVVLAGCMRTYWCHYVVQQTYDVTWAGWMMWIWTVVEANLGVICGNVPMLRTIFRPRGSMRDRPVQRRLQTYNESGSSSNGSGNIRWGPFNRRRGGDGWPMSIWDLAVAADADADLELEMVGKESGVEMHRPATDGESSQSGKQLDTQTARPISQGL